MGDFDDDWSLVGTAVLSIRDGEAITTINGKESPLRVDLETGLLKVYCDGKYNPEASTVVHLVMLDVDIARMLAVASIDVLTEKAIMEKAPNTAGSGGGTGPYDGDVGCLGYIPTWDKAALLDE